MGFLFGGGGGQSTLPRRLQGIEMQRSSYGEVIPLVYGRNRVAPTLVWYSDFTATTVSQDAGGKGGGGGSIVTGYNYSAACILAICEGPIDNIVGLYVDKDFTQALGDYGFTAFFGAGGQTTWSHLTSFHSAEAIPYDHTAYIAGTAIALGSSGGMPNISLVVQSLNFFSAGSSIFDCLPSVILTDYLTDADHGAQFPYLGSLTTWATYCQAMGLFLSPVEQTQRAAAEFVTELMYATNSNVVWSNGELTVVPYGDVAVTGNGTTFTPDMTPQYSITDDDLIYESGEDPITLIRKSQSQTYNRVRVEFLDKTQGYNTAIAEAWDDADIDLNGERPMQTVSLHGITNASTARLVAQLILQRQLYIVNTYTFRLRADFSLLDPMDLLDLTEANLGLDSQLVRIISITDEDNNVLQLEVEEVPLGIHNSPRYDWSDAQGYNANYGIDPGDIDPPMIFAAPPFLAAPEGGSEIWIAGSGGPNWGGANVWASYDNTDFRLVGTILGPSRYGTISTTFPSVADPDTSSTVRFTLADSNTDLPSTTTGNANELRNLLLVDDEVVSYRDSVLISTGVYDLDYFRRGVYGSDVAAHSSGAPFCRLDENLFSLPFDPGQAGQQLYFKFTSFNIYGGGEQDLASVTAVPFTIPYGFSSYPNEAVNLALNGDISLSGASVFKSGSAASLDCSFRTREAYSSCALSFTSASPGSHLLYVGLDSDNGNFTAPYPPKFAFRFSSTNVIEIYHDGSSVYTHGTSRSPSDTFSLSYDGQKVRFFINGVLVWAIPIVGQTFFGMGALYSSKAQVNNIRFTHSSGVQAVAGNLTSSSQWNIGGTGTQGNFERYWDNSSDNNSIVLGGGSYPLGPYDQAEPLWRTTGLGTGANGGWTNDGDVLGVDGSKPYRSVVWFRWNGTGNPTIALGFDEGNTNNLNGTANTNPKVFSATASALGIAANKWYLAVGVIQAQTYGTVDTGIAGIYDPETGQNIYSGTEFKFASLVPTQKQRVLVDSTNNGAAVLYFAKPRFEEITGAEPSIPSLLSPRGLLAYLDEVDTNELAAEAAGIVRSTSNTSTQTVPNDGSVTTLLSITVTTTGNPVSIDVDAIANHSFNGASAAFTWLVLQMDGANQSGLSNSMNFPPHSSGVLSGGKVSGVRTFTPAAGSHTFTLTAINSNSYGGTPTMSVSDAYMKLREYKR